MNYAACGEALVLDLLKHPEQMEHALCSLTGFGVSHAVIKLALPSQNGPKRHKKSTCENAKCLICMACLVEPGGFEPPSASTPLSVLHA